MSSKTFRCSKYRICALHDVCHPLPFYMLFVNSQLFHRDTPMERCPGSHSAQKQELMQLEMMKYASVQLKGSPDTILVTIIQLFNHLILVLTIGTGQLLCSKCMYWYHILKYMDIKIILHSVHHAQSRCFAFYQKSTFKC